MVREALTISIGRNIRTLRESSGITQTHFAELAGISRMHLSRAEAGRCNLSLPVLERIALLLDVSPRDLLSGKKSPSPPALQV